MTGFRSHPSDLIARAGAWMDAEKLTARFEEALADRDEQGAAYGYGAMEVIAASAIARVTALERRIRGLERARERQERRVRAELFPRSGDVIPLPVGRRSTTTEREGA